MSEQLELTWDDLDAQGDLIGAPLGAGTATAPATRAATAAAEPWVQSTPGLDARAGTPSATPPLDQSSPGVHWTGPADVVVGPYEVLDDVHPQVFARVVAEVPDPYRIAALLAAYAGLRIAQIIKLRREDITFEHIQVPGGGQVQTHPTLWAEVHWRPEGLLVVRRDGQPFHGYQLSTNFKALLRKRGISGVSLQALRNHVTRSMSTETLIRQHETWCAAQSFSPNTLRVRRLVLRNITGELSTPLLELTADQITDWLAQSGWSAQTRATYHGHLSTFFRWAVEVDIITVNPIAKIRKTRVPKTDPRPADPHLLSRILTEVPDPWHLSALLAAYQGLRACEISRLRREDVTAQRLIVRHGKGGKTAVLPTHPKVWEAVGHRGPGLLVTRVSGKPYSPATLSTRFAQTMRFFGIEGVTLHPLRHLYATTLLDNGANLRVVQTLLRHESIATTERYTRVAESQQVAAIATLDFAGTS